MRKNTGALSGASKLTHMQQQFVERYLANGGNATNAYRALYPQATYPSARTGGWRMLTNVDVRKAIDVRRTEAWAKHRIDSEQALDLIAMVAKADIAECYDDEGRLIPVYEWPLEVRLCVKEVKADGTVKLLDPLRARQLIAQAGGKLQASSDGGHFDHEAYLAARTGSDGQPVYPDRRHP